MNEELWEKLADDILDIYNDNVDNEYKFSARHEVEYFINNGEAKTKREIMKYLREAFEIISNELCMECIRQDEILEIRGTHKEILPRGR